MAETGYVYTLNDPRTGEPKYVGATVGPHRRLDEHIRGKTNDEVKSWIDELDSDGLSPEMTLVEVTSLNKLSSAEKRVIERLTAEWELLNDDNSTPYQYSTTSNDSTYKHIAVKPETKDRLSDNKPTGETWDRYFRRVVLGDE